MGIVGMGNTGTALAARAAAFGMRVVGYRRRHLPPPAGVERPPALERQREGKRERVVKVSEAPGLPFDYGHFELVLEDDPDALKARAVGE